MADLQNPVTSTPPPSNRIVPNEWEMLQSFLLHFWNRIVEDDFREDIDIDSIEAREGWGNWTSEQQIKYICRCKDMDSVGMTMIRMMMFMFIRNKIVDPTEFFATPVETLYREKVIYKPQLQLKFFESSADQRLNDRNYPLRLIVSWRLPDSPTAYTWTQIKALVNKIKLAFTPVDTVYDKGRLKFLYTDYEKGYDFRLMLSEVDAKKLITNVLQVMDDVPDFEEKLRLATKPEKNWNEKTRAGRILGKERYHPDFRPLGRVRLHSGQLTMYPLKPIKLFSVKRSLFISDVEQYQDALDP